MNNNTVIGIVIVLVLVVGGWLLFRGSPAPSLNTQPSPAETSSQTTGGTPATEPTAVTITYTDQGFSPKTLSVPVGTAVTWVNQSSGRMWIASANHPTHTVYSGTSLSEHCPDTTNSAFDECTAVSPGGSYSFTFNKVGAWGYHNHAQASDFGSVTVTAAEAGTP